MEPTQPKKILVVEDDVRLRKLLTDGLQAQKFLVIEAQNGKEGVEQALEKHPDLILLDLLMPVMGGMEALKKIREDEWGTKVPVIVLTVLSATDENLVKDMVETRPVYYLVKSDWKIHDVIGKIKEVLKI
jgi:DNA-binding response OmpR family regulator